MICRYKFFSEINYQIRYIVIGLHTYTTFSTGDKAALVVVGHCLIFQKSMDCTSAETRGELLFTFIVCSTVLWDCDVSGHFMIFTISLRNDIFYWVAKKRFENSVWKISQFYLGIIVLKKYFSIQIDLVSTWRETMFRQWDTITRWPLMDHYSDATFILAKSLPPKSYQNDWKYQLTDAWYSIEILWLG